MTTSLAERCPPTTISVARQHLSSLAHWGHLTRRPRAFGAHLMALNCRGTRPRSSGFGRPGAPAAPCQLATPQQRLALPRGMHALGIAAPLAGNGLDLHVLPGQRRLSGSGVLSRRRRSPQLQA